MKYNIALCGTFNVENYGDLMFPEVFKKALENRGLEFNLFLFSPEKSCNKALDDDTYIYSADQMDKIHSEFPIDAVVIGGGALVHYNKIVVKFPGSDEVVDYNIGESWYMPIEFATRNNIKVIFNLPQIPYPVSDVFKDTTRAAFNCCNYISLRDNYSKQYLLDLYDDDNNTAPNIDVFPDSVCCMPDLFDANELKKVSNQILGFEDKYAVIQFNPQKPNEDDKYLIEIINKLQQNNLKVVLLPIGYTHNDDFVLSEFNRKYATDCIIIEKKLNIFETASVLSCCDIYIGSSFHGAITAIAYGKKAISYNYIFPKNKNQEIFRMYDIPEFVGESAEEVLSILENLISGKLKFNPNLEKVNNQLNDYFDNICSIIKNKSENSVGNYFDFSRPVFKLLPELSKSEYKLAEYSAKLDDQIEHSKRLENIISEQLNEMEHCQKYIKDLETLRDSNNTHINNLESYINSLETYQKSLEANVTALDKAIKDMKNSFSWKATKPLRYISKIIKNITK